MIEFKRLVPLASALLLGLACKGPMAGTYPSRGPGIGNRDNHRLGPKADRCAGVDQGIRDICKRVRDEASTFVAKLAIDDQICLEGKAMDQPLANCTVRAYVADVSAEAIKLEVRDAPRSSRFKLMDEYWYHETALIDRYLVMAGFDDPK